AAQSGGQRRGGGQQTAGAAERRGGGGQITLLQGLLPLAQIGIGQAALVGRQALRIDTARGGRVEQLVRLGQPALGKVPLEQLTLAVLDARALAAGKGQQQAGKGQATEH